MKNLEVVVQKRIFTLFGVIAVVLMVSLMAAEAPWLFVGAVMVMISLTSIYMKRKLVL